VTIRHLVVGFLILLFAVNLALNLFVTVRVEVRLQATTEPASEGEQVVSLEEYLRRRSPDGRFIAYYADPSWEAAADEALTYLTTADRLLQGLGFSLGRFGVVLLPYPSGASKVVLERRGWDALRQILGIDPLLFPLVMPPQVRSLAKAPTAVRLWLHWAGLHEWVEGTIAKRLYFRDRRTRWVGDGLAEYLAYRITQALDPEIACEGWNQQRIRLRLGREQGWKTYNLIEDFPVRRGQPGDLNARDLEQGVKEQIGYGIAFVFWHRVAQRYGEDTIRRFWEELRRQSSPTAEDAARILQSLTGEEVWTYLQGVPLEEALRLLEDSPC